VQGGISYISAKVPYTGILDATTETFAQCRAEVREFVKKFANWPRGSSNALLPAEPTCDPIDFSPETEFNAPSPVCPLRA